MHVNVPPKHFPHWTPPKELGLPPLARQGEAAPRSPWLAAALSGIWPGLGQIYNGQFRKGVIILSVVSLWQLLGIGAVEFFRWWTMSLAAMGGVCLLASVDAWRTARRLKSFRPGPRNTMRVYLMALGAFTLCGLAAQSAERWAFPIYEVRQTSMRPTLRSGDRLRCKALGPRDVIRRGQLVVFEYPPDPALIFVKRVVGLPGEVVEVDDGRVYVNGDPIDEGFYAFLGPGEKNMDMPPTRLDPGEYYVMGDNRHASFDSRSFGPVPRARMLATPLYVIVSFGEGEGLRLDRVGLVAR